MSMRKTTAVADRSTRSSDGTTSFAGWRKTAHRTENSNEQGAAETRSSRQGDTSAASGPARAEETPIRHAQARKGPQGEAPRDRTSARPETVDRAVETARRGMP